MKLYIYHYLATYRRGDTDCNLNGILTCKTPITTMDRYREIKQLIEPQRNDLVVRSLSFLHEIEEKDGKDGWQG